MYPLASSAYPAPQPVFRQAGSVHTAAGGTAHGTDERSGGLCTLYCSTHLRLPGRITPLGTGT